MTSISGTAKIFPSLEDISAVIRSLKSEGQIIVQCHGVFDLFHPGHLAHLEEAKTQGDVLVVTLTPDHLVNKGPGRPVFTQDQRASIMSGLNVVDFVAITTSATAVEAIGLVQPDVFVKGPDYSNPDDDLTENISIEKAAVEAGGGILYFTQAPTMSSSALINTHLSRHDSEARVWLENFRNHYSESDVLRWLKDVAELRVLVIGEAIIDEYVMCEALGKSSKDPVLAFREISTERQIGGSLAIARHCAGLGAQVSCLFRVGSNPVDTDFVAERLSNTVSAHTVVSTSEPTIVKRRYVDSLTEARVFETYIMHDNSSDSLENQRMLETLMPLLDDIDLIVVADYGHGLLSSEVIAELTASGKMLAVNTQSNAGNRGFNTISRYPRVDFACLNGSEVGLELRRRHLTMNELVPQIRSRTGATRAIVTEGAKGLACCGIDGEVTHIPAFTQVVKDRVGAGDALFAVTALLSAVHTPADITGFYGNLAGAASVADLGNRSYVDAVSLLRHAVALMK